jgi:hypothetical protein
MSALYTFLVTRDALTVVQDIRDVEDWCDSKSGIRPAGGEGGGTGTASGDQGYWRTTLCSSYRSAKVELEMNRRDRN